MNLLVPIALFGWFPFVLMLFAVLSPVRAAAAAVIGGALFLPVATYPIFGMSHFTKAFPVSLAVLLGTMLFNPGRLLAFRPRWIDIPMLIWCLAPCLSSLSNGLGLYDGICELLSHTVTWGIPYLIGRLYFADAKGVRELAFGILCGGLLYVPLCLWEIRVAPTLHYYLYGFHQHAFHQHMRYGGYRPKVFMQNGLAVAMWMTCASLVALWLWRVGRETQLVRLPLWLVTITFALTTVLCKTLGAIVLLTVSCGVLYLLKWTRTRCILVVLCTAPVAYMYLRATQTWSARHLVELTATHVNNERAESLEARLVQEDLFSTKAWKRPLFGWGGWGRMFPTDELTGERLTRGIDSLWIIALGSYGLVGLTSWQVSLLLPPFLLLRLRSPSEWMHPANAASSALAVILLLHNIDCLFNGLVNPVFLLALGGLSGLVSCRAPAVYKTKMGVMLGTPNAAI